MNSTSLRIVFFGTPEFASVQLENLIKNNFNIAGVVTAPDKPAGRGKKLSSSAVKRVAEQFNLPVFQPEKLKDEKFLLSLKNLNADLFIVIAFRMLPEVVWKMPPLGTFNLHASLLPQYRGAAPINRAIMNGENETGLTTFFINEEIDNGNIILQKKMLIGPDENAGELHDRMIEEGKDLVVKTIEIIGLHQTNPMAQDAIQNYEMELKEAPKIFKTDCKIDWSGSGKSIFNHIRGLSPHPGAYATFVSSAFIETELKIFKSRFEPCKTGIDSFTLLTDNKSFLKVALPDGFIYLDSIQQAGKKVLETKEFLRGFNFEGFWRVKTL
jgi:methionyl-tRNA formyltransferase